MSIRLFSWLRSRFIFSLVLIVSTFSFEYIYSQPHRDLDYHGLRRMNIHNGNMITTEFWNYGSISRPGNTTTDIVWNGLGYGYEFGPFIGAEVEVHPHSHQDAYVKLDDEGNPIVTAEGDTVWAAYVISDGLVSLGGEVSPDGTEFWGFEPLDGYGSDFSPDIPMSDDLRTWTESWTSWPDRWQRGEPVADQEGFYVMDDAANAEFEYYPFADDSSRRGLGIEIDVHSYQFDHPWGEDALIFQYDITNISDQDLNDVIFGLWGDPHVGGASNWQDDLSFFSIDNNLTYVWDSDGISDIPGISPGYLGFAYLHSPGNPNDGLDNDGDGMIDESQSDAIDNDGDWEAIYDDTGIDGIPNTGDTGEGDGVPTVGNPFDPDQPGEPDYEYTDKDEIDQLGLTSYSAPAFGGQNNISNDDFVYQNFIQPGVFDSSNSTTAGDYIFINSSGTFSIDAGESLTICVAVVMGQTLDRLIENTQHTQKLYNGRLSSFIPPKLHEVSIAQPELDDTYDTSLEIQWEASQSDGGDLAIDLYFRVHPDSGWQFIESDLSNSGNYSWNTTQIRQSVLHQVAVVPHNSYTDGLAVSDHFIINHPGSNYPAELLILTTPSEGEIVQGLVPLTWRAGDADGDAFTLQLDISYDSGATWEVLENDLSNTNSYEWNTHDFPNGTLYQFRWVLLQDGMEIQTEYSPVFSVQNSFSVVDTVNHVAGYADATVTVLVVDSSRTTHHDYRVTFDDTTYTNTRYSVYDLDEEEFVLEDIAQITDDLAGPEFDGLRLLIDSPLESTVNEDSTHWNIESPTNYLANISVFNNLPQGDSYPGDFQIHWFDHIVDTSEFGITAPFKIYETTGGMQPIQWRFGISDSQSNGTWDIGDEIVFLEGESGLNTTWLVDFHIPAGESEVPPNEGDIFYFYTNKVLTSDDVFEFTSPPPLAIGLDQAQIAGQYQLDQNYPNPFNPVTTIRYHLPVESKVKIVVYDLTGREVATLINDLQSGGFHTIHWNGTDATGNQVATGMYFYRLITADKSITRKMILLK